MKRHPTLRRLALVGAVLTAALSSSCGFFNPNDEPHPIWGIWVGPYPTTISTEADSARWVFTSFGVYEFFALDADGAVLSHEDGYYIANGLILTLADDRAGTQNAEEFEFSAIGDRFTVDIEGQSFTYRRIGDQHEADAFEWVARRAPDSVGTAP